MISPDSMWIQRVVAVELENLQGGGRRLKNKLIVVKFLGAVLFLMQATRYAHVSVLPSLKGFLRIFSKMRSFATLLNFFQIESYHLLPCWAKIFQGVKALMRSCESVVKYLRNFWLVSDVNLLNSYKDFKELNKAKGANLALGNLRKNIDLLMTPRISLGIMKLKLCAWRALRQTKNYETVKYILLTTSGAQSYKKPKATSYPSLCFLSHKGCESFKEEYDSGFLKISQLKIIPKKSKKANIPQAYYKLKYKILYKPKLSSKTGFYRVDV